MIRRTSTLFLSVFVCVLLFWPHAARGESFERWYIVEIDGSKAGWAREAEVSGENNTITSTSELHFTFQRMGQAAKVSASTRFVETKAGDLVEMGSAQTLGTEEVKETYTFIRGIAGNEVRRVTETVGGKKEETLKWPEGDWLSPGAARRLIESRLAEGAETITYSSLDPSAGLTVVTLTQRIVKRDAVVEAAGKTVPAVEWEVTNSLMPGIVGRDFVDPRGVALRSELNLGGMKMTMLASEKEAALSDFAPPEMMAQTLVKHEGKKIERPREATRGVYILSMNDGSDMPDLPSVGAQVAERIDAKRVKVEVVRGRMSKALAVLPRDIDPAVQPSTMIASWNDQTIIELAHSVWPAFGMTPFAEAYGPLAERFVAEYIEEASLGVGFATASEVVRTRRGDCTEHAVLLAALLRAEFIGARVVSGVVYVGGSHGSQGYFGYHMWTQARGFGDGHPWMDLDAAILPAEPDAPGVDATHIALSTSTMADGEMINSMASLVGLLGRLKIEVVEVE